MAELQKVYALCGGDPPSDAVPPKANVYLSLLALRLSDYNLSVQAARVAAEQLRARACGYRPDEVSHILRYCAQIAQRAAHLGAIPLTSSEPWLEPTKASGSVPIRNNIWEDFPLSDNLP